VYVFYDFETTENTEYTDEAMYKYSKKALKWLMHMEKTDGVKIKHGRNGRV